LKRTLKQQAEIKNRTTFVFCKNMDNGVPQGNKNPVLNLIDMFTSDKSAHQDKWEMPHSQHPPLPQYPELLLSSRARPSRQYDDEETQIQVNNFLRPEEFDEFERQFGPDLAPRLERERSPHPGPLLQRRQPLPPPEFIASRIPRHSYPIYDISSDNRLLTAPNKERITTSPFSYRSSSLSSDSQNVDAHVSNIMSNLNIQSHQDTQRPRSPHPFTREHGEWLAEYDNIVENELNEFKEFEKIYDQQRSETLKPRESNTHKWHEEYDNEYEEIYNQTAESSQWTNEFVQQQQQHEERRDVGDLDIRTLTRQITQIDDEKLQGTNFMKLMSKLSTGEVKLDNEKFVEVTKEQNTNRNSQWVEEFNQEKDWHDEYQEMSKKWDLQNKEWLKEYANYDTEQWIKDYKELLAKEGLVVSENHDYEFQTENPFLQHPEPFQEGLRLFREGNIPDAILCFEAAVQKDPKHTQAWQLLGQAQAENDKDDMAIAALVKAVEAEPTNSEALMTLAVSYTNDFHKQNALEVLLQWLKTHPKYNDIYLASQPIEFHPWDFEQNHETITSLFLQAARRQPTDPDPDVQIALGLLFNLSCDYDKAVDCFKAALTKRPNDYLLWNKLGATQANGSRSEEAVDAYFRALEIKPTYTRARANLGISYLSLRNYVAAAQSFLGALTINSSAQHLWDNLKTVFALMNRQDLVELCDLRDTDVFKKEFTF
jgi:peroxin-5